ncbi:unnamed protein product [Gongylonema pulchrum]|uniref:Uncharacterized protein n=1 Tax=Gongylonema pulchrum TaxID=637853 RepID=A0A183F0F1_9BILA|nr:unnamed protein product [Gongylonema pulchrum]
MVPGVSSNFELSKHEKVCDIYIHIYIYIYIHTYKPAHSYNRDLLILLDFIGFFQAFSWFANPR